jgi:hypothetical protein
MKRLISFLAHTWALVATPIVLGTFMANDSLSALLADGTGVTVSPWHSGGPIARETQHDGYRTVLRQPVFAGLVGQRAIGFVQVEWIPADGRDLPDPIRDSVDYDGDGSADFSVELATRANRATVSPHSARVLGLEHVFSLERDCAIRVRLRRE